MKSQKTLSTDVQVDQVILCHLERFADEHGLESIEEAISHLVSLRLELILQDAIKKKEGVVH